MSKVHMNAGRGRPACAFKRWGSQVLTTIGDPTRVTCGRCLQTDIWRTAERRRKAREARSAPHG